MCLADAVNPRTGYIGPDSITEGDLVRAGIAPKTGVIDRFRIKCALVVQIGISNAVAGRVRYRVKHPQPRAHPRRRSRSKRVQVPLAVLHRPAAIAGLFKCAVHQFGVRNIYAVAVVVQFSAQPCNFEAEGIRLHSRRQAVPEILLDIPDGQVPSHAKHAVAVP